MIDSASKKESPMLSASASTVPLGKQSVLGMIALTVLTLGVYQPYWYLTRGRSFNSLASDQRLPEVILVLVLVASIVSAVLLGVSFFLSLDPTLTQPLNLLVGASLIGLAFRVRGILRDHLEVQGMPDPGISGGWTFLFNLYYLQYKLNQMPEWVRAGPGPGGLVDWEEANRCVEKGLVLADEGRWRDAISEFDSALASNAEDPRAYAERGYAYAELGDFAKAIADFDQAISRTPWDDEFDSSVYRDRGLAHAEQGDREAAIEDLERASSLTEDWDSVRELESMIRELRDQRTSHAP